MKAIFLAAAAVIATPLFAQTSAPTGTQTGASIAEPMNGTPAPQQQTGTPTDQGAEPTATDTTGGQTMQADPAMQSPQTTGQMAGQGAGSMPGATGSGMVTPAGGYQPSQAALSGAAQPGVQPRFQAAQSPDQAYPAPAPMAKYPVCKKGQYDKCIQRGGK